MNKKNIFRDLLLALTALVPCLICLLFVNSSAVSILFLDEWEMVSFCAKMDVHDITFADLFAQHNEHRIFFMYFAYLGLISVSGFNVIVPMWFSFAMILLLDFIILRYIASRSGVSDKRKYFFAALTSFLLFSLTQYENLLWGFQIGFVMVLFFSVLSGYFLCQMFHATCKTRRNIYFIVALLAAIIDSFSSSQGLITWVTGLVLFFMMFRKKTFSSPYFIVWTLVAIATWIAYFHNYVKPEHHPSLFYLFEHPGMFLQYFFSITGNAISGTLKAGNVVIGILLLLFLFIACVKIWKNKQVQQFIFPLALALNSLFILGSIAIGRVGLGVEQALASRYTTFSICLVVGVALLWMELKDKAKNKTIIKNMAKLFVVIILISIPLTMTEGLQNGKKIKTDRVYSAYILETANMQPDQFLQRFYPWPDSVRTRVTYLEQKKWSVFHRPQYAVPEILYNDSLAVANNEVLQFAQNTLKFAPDFMVVVRPTVHPKYKNDVKALYADIDGQVFPLYYKPEFNNRPPNPASIYDISAISNRVLSKGVHSIKFKALRNDRTGYYLINPGWAFEVK
ncbi:MAG: hypothetical protein LBF69_05885 [Prevotellaceae bacterium]|jgi:hypothetical protein|nr:hypothetical protein [Prevotellaceae bacterium]